LLSQQPKLSSSSSSSSSLCPSSSSTSSSSFSSAGVNACDVDADTLRELPEGIQRAIRQQLRMAAAVKPRGKGARAAGTLHSLWKGGSASASGAVGSGTSRRSSSAGRGKRRKVGDRPGRKPQGQPSQTKLSTKKTANAEPWACSVCTFINQPPLLFCGVCSAEKTAVGGRI
jgi:hypothetical protein